MRIAAGALNGRGVGHLARELGCGRAPAPARDGARAGRLAGRAGADAPPAAGQVPADRHPLPVTRVAFASGFQSLRRFNTVFQERYRMSPSVLRQRRRAGGARRRPGRAGGRSRAADARLSATARVGRAARSARGRRGARRRGRRAGPLHPDGAARRVPRRRLRRAGGVVRRLPAARGASADRVAGAGPGGELAVDLSASLLPVLMPLLARLRQLFDLDAEPSVIDAPSRGRGPRARWSRGGRGSGCPARSMGSRRRSGSCCERPIGTRARWPGRLRCRTDRPCPGRGDRDGAPGLVRLVPTAERVVAAGAPFLARLGVRRGAPRRSSRSPGGSRTASCTWSRARTCRRRCARSGSLRHRRADRHGHRHARAPVARRLFAGDVTLQRAAGVTGTGALRRAAERWRPWRAYAAAHLALSACGAGLDRPAPVTFSP